MCKIKMSYLISLSILVSVFSGCYAGSYCYTSYGFSYYTYCTYGCCFGGCCSFSIGAIVGIVIACITGFVILVVVCIALNKKKTRGRVIVAPSTTNVHHVSPGYGQQPMMTYNTMPGQYPQAPPPYTYTNPAYPPQKDGQQQQPPPQNYAAPPGTVPQPQVAPVGFEENGGPTAPTVPPQQPQQTQGPPNPFSAYANNKS